MKASQKTILFFLFAVFCSRIETQAQSFQTQILWQAEKSAFENPPTFDAELPNYLSFSIVKDKGKHYQTFGFDISSFS